MILSKFNLMQKYEFQTKLCYYFKITLKIKVLLNIFKIKMFKKKLQKFNKTAKRIKNFLNL